MHQFMDDDVIPHLVGQLDQTPIQRDGTLARTGTPAAPLIANDKALNVRGILSRQFLHPLRQLHPGRVAQMVLQRRAKIVGGIGQGARSGPNCNSQFSPLGRTSSSTGWPRSNISMPGRNTCGGALRSSRTRHCFSSQLFRLATNSRANFLVPSRGIVTMTVLSACRRIT